MAQAVCYPDRPKEADVTVENAVVSTVATTLNVNGDGQKKNRIQVSNTKKPLFFYLNLAKRYMKQHNDVEMSALGMAIPTLVTIVEILKANGVAVEKKVITSTVDSKDENKGRIVQKAKLEIFLERTDKPVNQKASAETTSVDTKDAANATADDAKSEIKSTKDDSKTVTKVAGNDSKN